MNNHFGDVLEHPPIDPLAQKKAELIACETIEEFITALQPLSRDQLTILKFDGTFCDAISQKKERQLGYMYDIRNNEHSREILRDSREKDEKRCIKMAAQTGAIWGLGVGGLGGASISLIGGFSLVSGLLTTGVCASAGGGSGYCAAKMKEQSIWEERKRQSNNGQNNGNSSNIAPVITTIQTTVPVL